MKWFFDEEEEEDKRPKWERGDPVLYWPLSKDGEEQIELPDPEKEIEVIDMDETEDSTILHDEEEEADSEEEGSDQGGELEAGLIDMDGFDVEGDAGGDEGGDGGEGSDAGGAADYDYAYD